MSGTPAAQATPSRPPAVVTLKMTERVDPPAARALWRILFANPDSCRQAPTRCDDREAGGARPTPV